jgi:glycosyltransferase involved in cell wall biosynthesis
MKIAFVNTSRGWGGAEEQMLAMAADLVRRGEEVVIVARRGGPIHERFQQVGHRLLLVERKGAAAVVAPFITAICARRERIDIIHCHRDHDLPLGKLLAVVSGAQLLLTQHCYPQRPSSLLYGMADRIVAVSAYIADGIRAKIPAVSAGLEVIHNGINLDLFADPDRNYWCRHPQVGTRGPLLGAVGAFYKGQEELISLLPSISKEFPQVALILIGEDDERKESLIAYATRLGVVDRVVFAGRIPREQMKDALASIDLNVSAFRNEGFGLSVIEGFAVGTPFVGYRAGGYPEVSDCENTGCLVADRNGLGSAIVSMLWKIKASKITLAEACRSVASRFSLHRMVETYVGTYYALGGRG